MLPCRTPRKPVVKAQARQALAVATEAAIHIRQLPLAVHGAAPPPIKGLAKHFTAHYGSSASLSRSSG